MTDTPPQPPNFTGFEPCATTDPELFFPENGPGGISTKRLRAICDGCRLSIYAECREWAVWNERWGFWGGMTATEREAERSARGIRLDQSRLGAA